MENTDEFVNLRIVHNCQAFELLIIKNDPEHNCVEYSDEKSDAYKTITKWATIGNLQHVTEGIKETHNGILFSEERSSFIEFCHETVIINFKAIDDFDMILASYLYNKLDQIELFIINEDDYINVIDEAELTGCISNRIRIKRKYVATF